MTGSAFERLEHQPVLHTVQRLEERIGTRFPERNLRRVAQELVTLVAEVQRGERDLRVRLQRTRMASAVVALLVVVGTAVVLGYAVHSAFGDSGVTRGVDWPPLIESTVNDLVFGGLAVFFLWGLPDRLARGHALRVLHRFRSLAHIIDMHQLTKDPERLRPTYRPTSASAAPDLDRDQMEYYLDYCSEMLSLVGKSVALVAEDSTDGVVLDAVAGIEALTVGMSREIWQKIQLLDKL